MDGKEFGSYIKRLREESGYKSQRALAEKSGISNGTIARIESGLHKPKPETLNTLANCLGVTYDELMFKAGYVEFRKTRNNIAHLSNRNDLNSPDLEKSLRFSAELFMSMYEDGELQKLKGDYAKIYSRILPYLDFAKKLNQKPSAEGYLKFLMEEPIGIQLEIILTTFLLIEGNFTYNHKKKGKELVQMYIDRYQKNTSTIAEESIAYKEVLHVPVLGCIPAGQPITAVEYIEDYKMVTNEWGYDEDDLFLLRVKGDSMIGSRIFDGDLVLVKRQLEVESGEIAVVNINGDDATLKRIRKKDGQTILYPDNPKYDPLFIEHEKARIIGKVIQVIFEPKRRI